MGGNSLVGIATSYGLDGPGIDSSPDRPGAHPAFYATGSGSFPGVEWLGRGVKHPIPSSAEVKKKSRG